MPKIGCAARFLAKDVKAEQYYLTDSGVFLYIGRAEPSSGGMIALRFARLQRDADRWEDACEMYVWETDTFFKGWDMGVRPVDCPFLYGETRKRSRLMWRTVGRESHLVTVTEGEEHPGDAPFQWLGLTGS